MAAPPCPHTPALRWSATDGAHGAAPRAVMRRTPGVTLGLERTAQHSAPCTAHAALQTEETALLSPAKKGSKRDQKEP